MIQMLADKITVEFDEEPMYIRKPPCPQRFTWRKQLFHIEYMVSEWRTDGRVKSKLRFIGVARIHFKVKTDCGRLFEIYFDPRSRPGQWILSAEIIP